MSGAIQCFAGLGIDSAGKSVLGIVGDLQTLVEALDFDNRQDRPKNFFLRDHSPWAGHLRIPWAQESSRLPESWSRCRLQPASLPLSFFNVAKHGVESCLVNDRAHVGVSRWIADGELCDAFAEALDEDVVKRRLDNGAGAGGAFLSAESECRGDDAIDCSVEVGVCADEDRIFAAHLEDGALDPDLAGLMCGGALVNLQADGLEPVKAMKRVWDARRCVAERWRRSRGRSSRRRRAYLPLQAPQQTSRRWWASRSMASE